MSRGLNVQWSHPLTVAVVAGLIGVAGTVAVAIIGSGSPEGPRPRGPAQFPRVAIEAVTIEPRREGRQSLHVRGVAGRLAVGHLVFAMAAEPESPTWFVSKGTAPDANGRWATRIGVDRPPASLSVTAVEAPATLPGLGCPQCRPGRRDTSDALELRGPDSGFVARRSAPVTVRPSE